MEVQVKTVQNETKSHVVWQQQEMFQQIQDDLHKSQKTLSLTLFNDELIRLIEHRDQLLEEIKLDRLVVDVVQHGDAVGENKQQQQVSKKDSENEQNNSNRDSLSSNSTLNV